jgi:nitrogen regulatory protein P-II 1
MKLVTAIVKSHRVEAVTAMLDQLDVSGITLTDVRGHGRQRGQTQVYRGSEYKVDFLPKVRIDVLVKDTEADKVANAIAAEARTGQIGDGKLWVMDVDAAIRIRTGEVGEDAL